MMKTQEEHEHDYVYRCLLADQDRKMQRKEHKVSLPNWLEEYRVWLEDEGEVTSISSYISYVKSVDKEVGLLWNVDAPWQEDYLCQMSDALKRKDKEILEYIFGEIEAYIDYCKRRKEEDEQFSEIKPKTYSDWKSGWRKFCKFLQSRLDEQPTSEAPAVDGTLVGNTFIHWLIEEEYFNEKSAGSYASRLKNIQKNLFEPHGLGEILYELPAIAMVHDDTALEIMNNLCVIMDNEVRQDGKQTGWGQNVAQSSQSTLRKYKEFITYFIDRRPYTYPWDKLRESIRQEKTMSWAEVEDRLKKSNVPSEVYEAERLYDIFGLRLLTQDRVGNDNKAVWFPIRKINQLLRSTDDLKTYPQRWVEESLDNMLVYTQGGQHVLSDVKQINIHRDKSVEVILQSGKRERMLTHNKEGELVPMEAESIREITIEHQPEMSRLLQENQHQWRGLPDFTKVVKNEVPLDHLSTHRLTLNLVFDLDFIVRNVKLELMQRKYNVNPGNN